MTKEDKLKHRIKSIISEVSNMDSKLFDEYINFWIKELPVDGCMNHNHGEWLSQFHVCRDKRLKLNSAYWV